MKTIQQTAANNFIKQVITNEGMFCIYSQNWEMSERHFRLKACYLKCEATQNK